MSYPREGEIAPDFELSADDGSRIRLSDLRGRKVILYFYPKDDTPGCTAQACDLRDHIAQFDARGAVVFGISADDLNSHVKFRNKYELPFRLLVLGDVGGDKSSPLDQRKVRQLNGRNLGEVIKGLKVEVRDIDLGDAPANGSASTSAGGTPSSASAATATATATGAATPATSASTASTGGTRRKPLPRAPRSARLQTAASAALTSPASFMPASLVPTMNSG